MEIIQGNFLTLAMRSKLSGGLEALLFPVREPVTGAAPMLSAVVR